MQLGSLTVNRAVIFGLAIAAGIVLVVLTVLAWSGSSLIGHHADGPFGLRNFKHGLLFLVLAVLAFLFAAVSRPGARAAQRG